MECQLNSAVVLCRDGRCELDIAVTVTLTVTSGIATGWTAGVDTSTPLLPEGVPEIDTVPLSLDGRCGGGVRVGKARSVLLRRSLSIPKWSSAEPDLL